MKNMSFSAAARDILLFWSTVNRKSSEFDSIIVPFSSDYYEHIIRGKSFRIFEDYYFICSVYLLSFERNGEIYWEDS